MKTQLQKWGNSLAIRIPREVVGRAKLRQGDELEFILIRQGALKLRRSRRRATLAELVRGITKKNRHPETDWGPPQGNELW